MAKRLCGGILAGKSFGTPCALHARRALMAGFDGEAAAVRAGILSIRQPVAEIAELALETMVARLKTPSLPVRTVLVGDSGICPQP